MMKGQKQGLDLVVKKTKVESLNHIKDLDKFCHGLFYLT
jgi:hypothetical protein